MNEFTFTNRENFPTIERMKNRKKVRFNFFQIILKAPSSDSLKQINFEFFFSKGEFVTFFSRRIK